MQPTGRSTQSLHIAQRTRYGPGWKIDLRMQQYVALVGLEIACSSGGEAAQKEKCLELRPVWGESTICGRERKDARWMFI